MRGNTSSRSLSGPRLIDQAKKQRLSKMSVESDATSTSALSDSQFIGIGSRSSTPSTTTRPSIPIDDASHNTPARRYRDAVEAPDSNKEQIQILLEEKIYHIAIQRLQMNLSMVAYQPIDTPIWIAPPAHLAFLGTLVTHPKFTTHPETDNEKILPVRAYQYLLDVLRSVGPINGQFKSAFVFRDTRDARVSRRRRGASYDSRDASPDADELKSPLASNDSLWSRVPDFWSMLGWAFNCAVAYPERWVHWKLWLEFLLELLEKDVEERKTLDEEEHLASGAGGDCEYALLKEAIIRSYIGNFTVGQILRVLFAFLDGEPHSSKEVWSKETQTRAETTKRKREKKLDLDKNQFGDYFDDEDESMDEADGTSRPELSDKPKRPRGRPKSTKKAQLPPLVAHPLLEETIPIRRRIFGLLSFLSHYLQKHAPFELYDLYERFAINIRDLPLDVYPHFVWAEMPLKEGVYMTLVRHVAAKLLPPEAVLPSAVDPETDEENSLSPIILEKCFLPYASNRVIADNAKLAVLLWETFSYMYDRGIGPQLSPGMREAVEKGIAERESKSKLKADRGSSSVVEEEVLDEMMGKMGKDEYSAENVLRFAHLKFRFMLEKTKEAERQQENALGGEFLGWK